MPDAASIHLPNYRKDTVAFMQTQFTEQLWREGASRAATSARYGVAFYPAVIELHATRKTDGRSVRLWAVDTELAESGTTLPEQATASTVDVEKYIWPGWAPEPMMVEASLHRNEGWVRPTRAKPRPDFAFWGVQLSWNGATERWWRNCSLVGHLFVALQCDRLFDDPRMTRMRDMRHDALRDEDSNAVYSIPEDYLV